ncbi:MAG: alpha/beta fold hydrolase [Oscillospiraceae bacterium]|nr:alpha/beta fold hydrolase [Oscillospiraceae bacterium]
MNQQNITLDSQVLSRKIWVNVFLPDHPTGKWLLLLHGYGGNESEWTEKSNILSLARKYQLTVVTPGCGDGYYEDTQEPMGQFLGEELPTFLHDRFHLSDQRENSCIAGVSMGGFGALLLGSRYSRVFGKIACLSGAFILRDVAIGNPGVLGNADVSYFRRVFGDFETLEQSDRDPLAQAHQAVIENRMSPVYLLCGDQDVLIHCNQRVAFELTDLGIPVVTQIENGGHHWDFWNHHLETVIQWLVQ